MQFFKDLGRTRIKIQRENETSGNFNMKTTAKSKSEYC